MPRLHKVGVVVAVALTAALSTSGIASAGLSSQGSSSGEAQLRDFDPASFPAQPRVDNEWYPLIPGSELVLEGRSTIEGKRGKHEIHATVTDLTKVIDGVRTAVVWERDVSRGQLLESEIYFAAEDVDGNVWLLGEYPAEYEDGKFARAPDVWISGVDGARAGISMRADPQTGTSSYLQGLAPAVEFKDRAKVARTGMRNCVPFDCFDDVLLIKESAPLEPKEGFQLKYFAPGVGNIRVGAQGGKQQEILVLNDARTVDAAGLAEARAAALDLEAHAYKGSKVYRTTSPLESCSADGQCTPAG
jgi:hypothetical protein